MGSEREKLDQVQLEREKVEHDQKVSESLERASDDQPSELVSFFAIGDLVDKQNLELLEQRRRAGCSDASSQASRIFGRPEGLEDIGIAPADAGRKDIATTRQSATAFPTVGTLADMFKNFVRGADSAAAQTVETETQAGDTMPATAPAAAGPHDHAAPGQDVSLLHPPAQPAVSDAGLDVPPLRPAAPPAVEDFIVTRLPEGGILVHSNGRMVGMQTAAGHTFQFAYDERGNPNIVNGPGHILWKKEGNAWSATIGDTVLEAERISVGSSGTVRIVFQNGDESIFCADGRIDRVSYAEMEEVAEAIHKGNAEVTFRLLEDKTSAERLTMGRIYYVKYGQHLTDELAGTFSGAELVRAHSLLRRDDGSADVTDRLYEALTEREQWLHGRTDASVEGVVRNILAHMNSRQISALEEAFQHRYQKSLWDVIDQSSLSQETKQACKLYRHGVDQRNSYIVHEVGSLALQRHDIDMFIEAMRSDAQAVVMARSQFTDKQLIDAFGDPQHRDSAGRPAETYDYLRARDYLEFGRLRPDTLVKANVGISVDEQEIESILKGMSAEEHQLYRNGRRLAGVDESHLAPDLQMAKRLYEKLHDILGEAAGDTPELFRWEELARGEDDSLLGRVAHFDGYLSDTPLNVILESIEGMSHEDFWRLKTDAVYRHLVATALDDFLSEAESGRCRQVLDGFLADREPGDLSDADKSSFMAGKSLSQKLASREVRLDSLSESEQSALALYRGKAYSLAQDSGRRSLIEVLADSTPGGSIEEFIDRPEREGAVVKRILDMTAEEQEAYRTIASFREKVVEQLRDVLSPTGQRAALHLLNGIVRGQQPSEDLIVKLNLACLRKDPTQAIREIQKALNDSIPPKSITDLVAERSFYNGAIMKLNLDANERSMLLHDGHVPISRLLDRSVGSGEWLEDLLTCTTPAERQLFSRTWHDGNNAADAPQLALQRDCSFTEEKWELARAVVSQAEVRSEDLLRSYVLGMGPSADELREKLSKLSEQQSSKARADYARKYSADICADLADTTDNGTEIWRMLRRAPESGQDAYLRALDEYSRTREGIGKEFVNAWNSSGYRYDELMSEFQLAVAEASGNFKNITPEQTKQLDQKITEAFEAYRRGEKDVSAFVSDVVTAVGAIAATPLTVGASTAMLFSTSVAAALTAATARVAIGSAIAGSDYSDDQFWRDFKSGFVDGATSFAGPTELAALFGIGKKAGMQAAKNVAIEATDQARELAARKSLESGLVRLVADTLATGNRHVDEKAIAKLAERVLKEAGSDVSEAAVKDMSGKIGKSLAESLDLETKNFMTQLADGSRALALNTAAGAAGGALGAAARFEPGMTAEEKWDMVLLSASVAGGSAAAMTLVMRALSTGSESPNNGTPGDKTTAGPQGSDSAGQGQVPTDRTNPDGLAKIAAFEPPPPPKPASSELANVSEPLPPPSAGEASGGETSAAGRPDEVRARAGSDTQLDDATWPEGKVPEKETDPFEAWTPERTMQEIKKLAPELLDDYENLPADQMTTLLQEEKVARLHDALVEATEGYVSKKGTTKWHEVKPESTDKLLENVQTSLDKFAKANDWPGVTVVLQIDSTRSSNYAGAAYDTGTIVLTPRRLNLYVHDKVLIQGENLPLLFNDIYHEFTHLEQDYLVVRKFIDEAAGRMASDADETALLSEVRDKYIQYIESQNTSKWPYLPDDAEGKLKYIPEKLDPHLKRCIEKRNGIPLKPEERARATRLEEAIKKGKMPSELGDDATELQSLRADHDRVDRNVLLVVLSELEDNLETQSLFFGTDGAKSHLPSHWKHLYEQGDYEQVQREMQDHLRQRANSINDQRQKSYLAYLTHDEVEAFETGHLMEDYARRRQEEAPKATDGQGSQR